MVSGQKDLGDVHPNIHMYMPIKRLIYSFVFLFETIINMHYLSLTRTLSIFSIFQPAKVPKSRRRIVRRKASKAPPPPRSSSLLPPLPRSGAAPLYIQPTLRAVLEALLHPAPPQPPTRRRRRLPASKGTSLESPRRRHRSNLSSTTAAAA